MIVYDMQGNKYVVPSEDTADLDDLLPNRLLIWHDEFKDNKIDETKWNSPYGKSNRANMVYAKDIRKVTSVGDGLAYRTIKDYPTENDEFSAPYLQTNNLFEFRYGRIEAKMKFPSATPHHSTFWTLGANSDRKVTGEFTQWDTEVGVKFPSCGEIDIAEFNNGSVGARTHWATNGFDESETSATGGNNSSIISDPTNWHIYACEWTATTITFYVDGVQKSSFNVSDATVDGWNPFNHPHFILLNGITALSGTINWEVAETQVKWVRVYAPVGVTEYIPETAISIPASASISVNERHWLGTPTFTPENPSDMTVQWLSHNEDIVTCYGGMLIGVSAGTTYVQATSKHGYTALCKVTVS